MATAVAVDQQGEAAVKLQLRGIKPSEISLLNGDDFGKTSIVKFFCKITASPPNNTPHPPASTPVSSKAVAANRRSRRAKQAASDENVSGIRAFIAGVDAEFYLRGDLAAARALLDSVPTAARASHRD